MENEIIMALFCQSKIVVFQVVWLGLLIKLFQANATICYK